MVSPLGVEGPTALSAERAARRPTPDAGGAVGEVVMVVDVGVDVVPEECRFVTGVFGVGGVVLELVDSVAALSWLNTLGDMKSLSVVVLGVGFTVLVALMNPSSLYSKHPKNGSSIESRSTAFNGPPRGGWALPGPLFWGQSLRMCLPPHPQHVRWSTAFIGSLHWASE